MVDPPEDRRPPMTPQLARRVAFVGTLTLALFAVIFFRLWFLQVLTGSQYVRAAQLNQVRYIPIQAPRGEILDRNGAVLVNSTRALAVQIIPSDLPAPVSLTDIATIEHPPRADSVVYNRLAHVLRMSTRRTRCALHIAGANVFALSRVACIVGQQVSQLPYANVNVATQVSRYVQYYLAERQTEYDGVAVEPIYVTGYPRTTLAAQVLGTVGRISSSEYGHKGYAGISPNAVIGQSGLEAQYDSFLRGSDGVQKVQVDAQGQPTGASSITQPTAGHNLQLSLDAKLQQVGQSALAQSMASNGGVGGAFVALDPQSGSVYGMGSEPSFDPSVFSHLSQSTYNRLISPAAGEPLLDRAIQSVGPTGSTFKPITATAALQSGQWTTTGTFDDTGQYCVGTGAAQQCRHNAGHAVDGVLDLTNALRVSSDDFFYHLGALTNPADPTRTPNGGPLDQWARLYGIGRNPGIDLPGAATGTLPDPRWRASRNRLEAQCDSATGTYRYTNGTAHSSTRLPSYHPSPRHAPGGCGIADGTNRPWSIGDNESLAVGQGDVQVSPLQLAVAYSALANGGTIVRPHIGESVQSQDGTILQKIDPAAPRHIPVNPLYLETIRAGLRAAASQPGGTSYDVMGRFQQQVYGKTGTAQYFNAQNVETDYAWYACFVPATATSKPIVVVVWVEKGGFGDVGAAPVARQILSQWFYGKAGPYVSGSSRSY